MASESYGLEAAELAVSTISTKAFYAALAVLLIGSGIASAIDIGTAMSFAAGAMLGMINQRLQLRGIGKTIYMPPEKAALFAQLKFYSRLGLTAISLGVLLWSKRFSPLPLVLGFVSTHIVTIAAIAVVLKKEKKNNA